MNTPYKGKEMTVQEMNQKRREIGCSYVQIAELSGVPLSTVQKVLGGVTKHPRLATLRQMEKAFRAMGSGFAHSDMTGHCLDGMVREPLPVYRGKKPGDCTLEDYLALPDETRAELIDGVIYNMSSPPGHHQLIAGSLYAMLLNWISANGGNCIPFIAPTDVQLDCDDRTIVQPDVFVLCDLSKYNPARIVGAPDLVVEILSPSTRSKDMLLKLRKYRNAGVREYWIVDPDKRIVITYFFGETEEVKIHSFRDRIPVMIYEGKCVVDFSVIDDYVEPFLKQAEEEEGK